MEIQKQKKNVWIFQYFKQVKITKKVKFKFLKFINNLHNKMKHKNQIYKLKKVKIEKANL